MLINLNNKLKNIYTININSTPNNILITILENNKNIIYWASAGRCGLKGTKKSTPYAAQSVIKLIITKLYELKITSINIIIKGKGITREIPIKFLKNASFKILSIKDKSLIAFNGCRLPKPRKL